MLKVLTKDGAQLQVNGTTEKEWHDVFDGHKVSDATALYVDGEHLKPVLAAIRHEARAQKMMSELRPELDQLLAEAAEEAEEAARGQGSGLRN